MTRDWFAQYMAEEAYMITQGGWVEAKVEDIFIFAMHGFKQQELPIDLEVSVVRTNEIVARIPDRDKGSPYGFFEVSVYQDMLNVALYHPRWTLRPKHWTYLFNGAWGFREVPWREWNECLEWIE